MLPWSLIVVLVYVSRSEFQRLKMIPILWEHRVRVFQSLRLSYVVPHSSALSISLDPNLLLVLVENHWIKHGLAYHSLLWTPTNQRIWKLLHWISHQTWVLLVLRHRTNAMTLVQILRPYHCIRLSIIIRPHYQWAQLLGIWCRQAPILNVSSFPSPM